MNESLEALQVTRKTGEERFRIANQQTQFNLLGFWQWHSSDLTSNALRGALAEYIVACDLGMNVGTRTEWDAFDLKTLEGIKVEVKSAAYLQSWKQSRPSRVCFNIGPAYGWDASTNTSSIEKMRHADVYVFCVLKHIDKLTLDPLDLSQWDFYLLPTSVLNERLGNQSSITLASLLRLHPSPAKFGEIKQVIQKLFNWAE